MLQIIKYNLIKPGKALDPFGDRESLYTLSNFDVLAGPPLRGAPKENASRKIKHSFSSN
jgi:hypothetical protein